ncbi:hypothetical protein CCP3SC1_2000002 [Gammaproteobacteria bacterium]
MVRPARPGDLPDLLRLEQLFPGDRLSRRSFLHLLQRGHADLLVAEGADGLTGDAVILYRQESTTARLYSIIVTPSARGCGIGYTLLEASEAAARAHGRTDMVLEVRTDNSTALALYYRAGYRSMKHLPDYYQDGAAGLRLAKSLSNTVDKK